MAIQILGADGLTVLKVDSTSDAARATLYDQYGNPMSDVNSLGNVLNALNAAVTLTLGGQSTVGFNVAATSGTITLSFEATIDNSTWVAIPATPVGGGSSVTSTTANGQWVASVGGFYAVRARVSAITGGASMTVSVVVTPGTSTLGAQTVTGTVTGNQGAPNTVGNSWPVEVTDGTNVLGTPAHPVRTDPTGTTTQPVSGTVTGNQGTAAALAGAWPVEVTDGTHTLPTADVASRKAFVALTDGTNTTAVKAASTPAAAADPSAVVALSPNSPLPAGSNALGSVTVTGTTTISGTVTANQGTAAALAGAWPVEVTDGTNVLGTAAHPVRTDPTGTTTQPVSGTVTAQQATAANLLATVTQGPGSGAAGTFWFVRVTDGTNTMPTMDTAGRAGFQHITDGTNTAAVKAASTPAAATDPSLVVALSPNSPLPAGSNALGSVSVTGTTTIAGTVTANQGTAAALSGHWPVQITDGTNVFPTADVAARKAFFALTDGTNTTAVKAASTAAAAADPAAVVALSPNTPTPVAADNIGSGNITTLGGSVAWGVQGYTGQVVQISGAWTGTLAFQFSIDGGTTWWADTVENNTTGVFVSTITANGLFINLGIGAYRQYRLVSTGGAFTGTATVAWDASAVPNALVTQSLISDSSNNGPAAVKPATTAPVAADPALVIAVSPNSYAAADRSTVTVGTKHVAVVGGFDGIGAIARAKRVSEFGTQRTTSEILLWHDAFEGSTVNAFWTQSTTTMTIAQATGVLTLNNSSITTANTDAIITSQRQFPKYPRTPLCARFHANITANVAANHTLVELGFGAPSGVTAVINNGAFFRWTAAGNLNAVISYNGTEQSTQVLAQGTISTTEYYYYTIIADDDFVRFLVTDSSGVPVVDTQVSVTNTVPFLLAVSHIPTFSRVYVDATGGGTAIDLKLAAHSVQILDAIIQKAWNDQLASSMRNAGINPTSYAQTTSSFTAAPATLTPANATAGYAFLGGEFAFATVVGFESGASVFAFQIPSPYTFYLTGVQIPAPVVATTIATTGVPYIEWLIASNATTNLLSTGGGFRQGCGIVHACTSAAAAQGSVWNGGLGSFNPRGPIPCLPGTFLHIGFKILGATAVTTAGLHRGTVTVDGYFE